MSIKRLPPEIAVRIAAGEVVERPVSVVKELLENSLDSGASMISIWVVQGGRLSVTVEDNGKGMDGEDLPMSIESHATSKISSLEDLESVTTLGYRGEALASIAAVSRFYITSRTNSSVGVWMKVEGGTVLSQGERSCRQGTRVQVDDLFFNLPARRKFLKSPMAEMRRITKLVQEYSVAYPEVAFILYGEDRLIYETSGGTSRGDVLGKLWGKDPEIHETSGSMGNYDVRLWWQRSPGSARMSLISFVNGRRIEEPTIKAAIAAGEISSYGNWAVWIETPPDEIDVNVHPAKTEVLFRHGGDLFSAVRRCASSLQDKPVDIPMRRPVEDAHVPTDSTRSLFSRINALVGTDEPGETTRSEIKPAPQEPTPFNHRVAQETRKDSGGDVIFMGQLRSGYLVFDDGGALVIMDPHAAHERLNFEAIRQKCTLGYRTQRLAVTMALSPSLSSNVEEKLGELTSLGFVLEPTDGLLALVGVPEIPGCDSMSPVTLLRSTLSGLEDGSVNREAIWLRWATIACKASVKLTWSVSPIEAIALWDRLSQCESPPACPHGRPAILRMSTDRIAANFERS